jgi:glucokinase
MVTKFNTLHYSLSSRFMIALIRMKNESLAIGLDIGGTNTKIGILNAEGNLLSFLIHPTSKDCSPEVFIEQLSQECNQILQSEFNSQLGDKRILGVGAGAPMANYETGYIDYAPNLGWKNVPLQNLIKQKFKTNALIENDANLAAVGEKKWGAGRSFSHFILVTLGTGVGTGIILHNKLYRGHLALGGEGGHVLIPHQKTRLCSCGGMNHLESFLSAKGIKQTIKELTGEEWTIEKLGIKFSENDLKAQTIIDTIANELVSGLVSMSVLLAPEAFLVGGGVSKLGETFDKLVESKLNSMVHYSLKNKIQVLPATLSGEKGAIFGGAALIFEEFSP